MHSIFRAAACVWGGLFVATMVAGDSISERAKKLHFSSIVVDTHDDTTQRLLDNNFDLGVRHSDGSIDIPRMREGNLSAIFFSIWIPSKITEALMRKGYSESDIRKILSGNLLRVMEQNEKVARELQSQH